MTELFNADGSRNEASRPARPGEVLTAWVTGLGAVDGPIASGQAAPLDALLRATARVHVLVGGTEAEVLFAGLAPGRLDWGRSTFACLKWRVRGLN